MKKNIVIILSGIGWILLGIMLISKALSWIDEIPNHWLIISTAFGITIGIIKYIFIFRKISIRSKNKILNFKEDKINILKLYPLKSYIIVAIMIAGGITIRHLEFIPKSVLFALYLGIGIAMLLTSILFFVKQKKSCVSN